MSSEHTESGEVTADVARRNRRMWGYFRRYLWWFLGGAFFLVLTNLLGLEIPEQLGNAIQKMREAGIDDLGAVRAELIDIAWLIMALAVGAGIARIFSRITIFNAGRYIEFDIRNELYAKLASLTPAFYGSMPTGDITSRVSNDVGYIRLLYAVSYLHIINTFLAFGIALNKMVGLSWELTLWCLLPYPFLLAITYRLIRALFTQTKIVQAQLSTISSKVQENLSGVGVVKTYALQDREKASFGEMNEEFLDKNMGLATIRGGVFAMMTTIAGAGTLVVLWVGSQMVIDGVLTLGQFVEFNGYVVALAFPTTAMGWVLSVWHRGLAGFDRVLGILDREPVIDEPEDGTRLPLLDGEPRGRIEFDGVTFSYDEDERVLHDVDIDIPAGSTVAIVGRTGSGKSTLVRLLARLHDPDAGEIRIDGEPLDGLRLRDTRSEIGVVSQEPFLFSMTIGQNIRFGIDALERDDTVHRSASTRPLMRHLDGNFSQAERIEQALEIAGLAPDIDSFPKGLETLVGERGITLSGGQKQRTTIARALMIDPRILLLDDALSSVDTQTEKIILDHLEHIMEGRTSVIVTHRFNALSRVDRIFVLEEGRVVERGTHDELRARGGVYAELYARQQLEETLGE